MKYLAILAVLCLCSGLPAETQRESAESESHVRDHASAVVLSHDATWAGVVIIVSLGMFLMAAAIGAAKDMNAPDEPPPEAHHDDHGSHSAQDHDSHGHRH